MVTQTIGTRVRAARAEAGLSRKQLSARADVSERYLSQLETGDANVSIGVLGRVASALSIDLVSLLPATGGHMHGAPTIAVHEPLAALVGGMSLREQEAAVAVLERYLARSAA